jgi:invasion protein IalB
MRNFVVGIVLSALLLGGLFALSKYDPAVDRIPNPGHTASQIQPGFVGTKQVGAWLMACGAPQTPGAALGKGTFGRCRLNLVYHRKDNPKQIVLLVTMRLLGPAKNLAVIVVMPPIVKVGDVLELHAGQRLLKMPISICKEGKCVTVVALQPRSENELLVAPNGVLVFPADPNGKRGAIGVPFAGLREAIGAMRRAES